MNDLTFTITKTMIGGAILTVSGILLKRGFEEKFAEWKARREAFEAHIKACAEKNTSFALLKQKVDGLAHQVEADGCERKWLGDCVVAIGTKMKIRLPDRP
jgi:hypothetical protein